MAMGSSFKTFSADTRSLCDARTHIVPMAALCSHTSPLPAPACRGGRPFWHSVCIVPLCAFVPFFQCACNASALAVSSL